MRGTIIKEHDRTIQIPFGIGDIVYVICQCRNIPEKLDGDWNTATGDYCPYLDTCPHEKDDSVFECNKYSEKNAVFKDEVTGFLVEEAGVRVFTRYCNINGKIGTDIFDILETAKEKIRIMSNEENENSESERRKNE